MRWFYRTTVWLLPLACSGLLPVAPSEDAGDEAVAALAREDFAGAEAILNRRLEADPKDARSARILGDVNLIRGQRFQEKWKENLGWAIDAYVLSVKNDPASCPTWGRLAGALVAAADNPATAVPRSTLDALPLAAGWAACPGAALLEVEWHRRPTEAELGAADLYLTGEASETERLAAAAPWIADGVRKVDLSGVDWQAPARPALAGGTAFVVLEVPVTGDAVAGSDPRPFTTPERLTIHRVVGNHLVYVDRRFPARVPEIAFTRTTGCPGTTWDLQGVDRVPVGTCAAGKQDRRASELYDPKILKPTGIAHFHEPSIRLAEIPWEAVADKTVMCLEGPVGRLFVDTPSCQVSYDRAIPQTRSLPIDAGLTAWSPEQAERWVGAARGVRLFGDAAPHLARGEAGVGLPFGLFAWTWPELPGCNGRGVYTKLQIVDGALEFACTVQGATYVFRELSLVEISPAAG